MFKAGGLSQVQDFQHGLKCLGSNPALKLRTEKGIGSEVNSERRTRREFLRPRAVRLPDGPFRLIRAGRPAMAGIFEVVIRSENRGYLEAVHLALNRDQELEAKLSFFREDSDLGRVNRLAAEGPVRVGRDCFEIISKAVDLGEATSGAFDISAGPLWRCWGFHRRQGQMPESEEIAEALQRVGFRWIELNAGEGTVRLNRQGMEINLGSIGKGYALDRAADELRKSGLPAALLHAGYSSMVAWGDSWRPGSGWRVEIAHPWLPSAAIARLRLQNQALATSGLSQQFFEHEGKRYGHILDPRTGWPVENRAVVSVVAPEAAQADALATAFFILSPEEIDEFCKRDSEIGALVVEEGDGGSLLYQRFGSLKESTRERLEVEE